MALVVTCRTCKQDYEPSRRDIVAGRWQRCPTCRNEEAVDD